jgi:hypothetical protein
MEIKYMNNNRELVDKIVFCKYMIWLMIYSRKMRREINEVHVIHMKENCSVFFILYKLVVVDYGWAYRWDHVEVHLKFQTEIHSWFNTKISRMRTSCLQFTRFLAYRTPSTECSNQTIVTWFFF